MCLFIRSVNHEQFPMQMTHITKHNKWLQTLAGKILHRDPSGARTPNLNSASTTKEKTSTRNRRAEEQSKHRLAQRRQRRQQETEEQRNRRLGLPLFFFLSVLLITILARLTPTSTRAKQCSTFYSNKGCH